MWRRDAAKAVRNLSSPAAGDRHFAINGNKQEDYAQNNWMLVSLPVERYNQVNEKSTVTSITGTLDEKLNVAMTATNVVAGLQEKQLTSRLRFDWLPGASHGALARAFYLKDTYDWLFAHSLQDEGRPVEEYISIDNAILKMAYSELRELRALVGEDD